MLGCLVSYCETPARVQKFPVLPITPRDYSANYQVTGEMVRTLP